MSNNKHIATTKKEIRFLVTTTGLGEGESNEGSKKAQNFKYKIKKVLGM